jgi:hypothetical protein
MRTITPSLIERLHVFNWARKAAKVNPFVLSVKATKLARLLAVSRRMGGFTFPKQHISSIYGKFFPSILRLILAFSVAHVEKCSGRTEKSLPFEPINRL